MNKNKLFFRIMLFIFTLSATKVSAQQHILTGQKLNAQQQGIKTISAPTATGDLENLKKQLNTGLDTGLAEQDMMVRISEIEIAPEYLEAYKSILKEEAAASVKIERGVIAIFPMYQQLNPTQIRILEIYANKAAYQSHLQTTHFKNYKSSTLKMVKSLKLVDMESIDKDTMQKIFKKLK